MDAEVVGGHRVEVQSRDIVVFLNVLVVVGRRWRQLFSANR